MSSPSLPTLMHASYIGLGHQRSHRPLLADVYVADQRGQHASGSGWGDCSLFYGWCTHGNDIVHICTESCDALLGTKVNISVNDTLRRIATSFTA